MHLREAKWHQTIQGILSTVQKPTTPSPIGQPYRIHDTSLFLLVESRSNPLDVKDTLLLLIEGVFSAPKRLDAGGDTAKEPVEVFTPLYGSAQLQLVGFGHRLTPFKVAAIFEGLTVVGAKSGYYQSAIMVVGSCGRIAKIDIL